MVDHPNIKSATSLVDYIFRLLGYEYLNRTDLVHVMPQIQNKPLDVETLIEENGPELSEVRIVPTNTIKAKQVNNNTRVETTQAYMKTLQSDAPACNTCGHITVRSGTCYKCLNCGNSMGCS